MSSLHSLVQFLSVGCKAVGGLPPVICRSSGPWPVCRTPALCSPPPACCCSCCSPRLKGDTTPPPPKAASMAPVEGRLLGAVMRPPALPLARAGLLLAAAAACSRSASCISEENFWASSCRPNSCVAQGKSSLYSDTTAFFFCFFFAF